MSAAFYFDENSADSGRVRACRQLGLDCLTAVEAGMLGKADPEHLRYAASGNRAIVTEDRGDFTRLHTRWLASEEQHAGIVLVHQSHRIGPGEFARRLVVLAAMPLEQRLVYLR